MSAFDNAGNEGTLTVGGINVDSTAPSLSFTGIQALYSIADVITIGCDVSDGLSGIDTVDCDSVPSVLAVDYSTWADEGGSITGTFTVEATAVDLAGNTTTISDSFAIVVDNASLADLVERYAGNGPGVNGLLAKLDQGDYQAFINQVNAKCCTPANGKLFSQAEAAALITLATELNN
ncbi:MAG: Ig-like domain repeat protein [Acidimicrobiales bacterium]